MFITFFTELKSAGVPVSVREYLTLMEALEADLAEKQVDDFYHLARVCLVKDERHLDRFDQVFGRVFKGIVGLGEAAPTELPAEWLAKLAERFLSEEEKAKIQALGGFEKLMETLKERLAEQKKRHQGGNKWIGTAGTSPFGAYGYNPEGVRIGQDQSRHRRAVKVWDKREFRDLDGSAELGTRNIKVALKRLRRFARQGAADELDLDGTVKATAAHGFLDVQMRPERRNAVKLLVFFDIGGSMDDHVRVCEELFAAVRGEFKTMEWFYFHNCLYDRVWKRNDRRHSETIETFSLLHKYPSDYKVIFVGDATMSPYELTMPGGSVEHWNEEAGAVWLDRMTTVHPKAAWLNPVPETAWRFTPSIEMVRRAMAGRMYPLTLEGLDRAARELAR
ncbi:VWA domain-containing protein [Siculibacillus lacustris]|uniref:VWA domain-containing protein n=1 Tax=Siculibacillus lacustris TaxID=1549641 RepID=A0A4Q9VF66_9HYPH|nr:VWA domain-containing protein [Siculibacillus lacustris]TBW33515.1 VWA domain-containing protein [Siculibacillus lacustris]